MGEKVTELIIKRISELCEERNLSLNALARASGLPHSTVKNIIYNASKNPGIVTIFKICDGLGVSLIEFFDTEEFKALSESYLDN